jgi:hypothetical protein
MLEDQTFHPMPLVAVGPELFRDTTAFGGIEYSYVAKFRTSFSQFPVCRYVYVALLDSTYGDQKAFSDKLTALGVTFADVVLAKSTVASHVQAAQKALRMCDIVFSPEVCKVAKVKRLLLCNDVNPKAFMEALRYFHETAVPFKADLFLNLAVKYHHDDRYGK